METRGVNVETRSQLAHLFRAWLLDPARGTSSRFTFTNFHDTSPRWSPDGSRIVFSSNRDGGIYNLYQKIASGAGPDELLLKTEIDKAPEQWSADGRVILPRLVFHKDL